MDLEQVVVVEAAAAAAHLQDAEAAAAEPVFVPKRLHRKSMTLAAEQVFEAMGTGTQGELPEAYNRVYANWLQTSAVDVPPPDDGFLAARPVPLRTWLKWACRAAGAVAFCASCTAAAVLGATGSSAWRWPAWAAATLAAWALDSAAFFLLAVGVETAFATSQHVIYYMQGARRPAERFMAACASLAVFCGLFQPFDRPGSTQALKALICVALACLGLLLAQVCTKVLAAHHHRKGFFAKLREALREEYFLMALSKPRGARMRRKSWTEQAYFKQARGGRRRRGQRRERKLAEAQLLESDPGLMLKLDAVETHVRKNRLKLVFDRCAEVKDEASAKQLAFYIFWNVMEDRTREWLVRDDLTHFLPEADVDAAFAMLDIDGDGRPTWQECRQAVTAIFARRQQITDSLQDTDTIIGTVHVILVALVQVVFFFLYLLVWHVDVVRVWLTFSSIALAFTFVFGTWVKTQFENVVFLFSTHPYDVGDRLRLEDATFTVHKLRLSTTVFEQDSGVRVWWPNNRLAAMPIHNLTRAQVVRESFA